MASTQVGAHSPELPHPPTPHTSPCPTNSQHGHDTFKTHPHSPRRSLLSLSYPSKSPPYSLRSAPPRNAARPPPFPRGRLVGEHRRGQHGGAHAAGPVPAAPGAGASVRPLLAAGRRRHRIPEFPQPGQAVPSAAGRNRQPHHGQRGRGKEKDGVWAGFID